MAHCEQACAVRKFSLFAGCAGGATILRQSQGHAPHCYREINPPMRPSEDGCWTCDPLDQTAWTYNLISISIQYRGSSSGRIGVEVPEIASLVIPEQGI